MPPTHRGEWQFERAMRANGVNRRKGIGRDAAGERPLQLE